MEVLQTQKIASEGGRKAVRDNIYIPRSGQFATRTAHITYTYPVQYTKQQFHDFTMTTIPSTTTRTEPTTPSGKSTDGSDYGNESGERRTLTKTFNVKLTGFCEEQTTSYDHYPERRQPRRHRIKFNISKPTIIFTDESNEPVWTFGSPDGRDKRGKVSMIYLKGQTDTTFLSVGWVNGERGWSSPL